MKAWILIAFYLWKDIWSRWLETPGAVLARLAVAILLASLLFFAQAGFELGGRSIEQRIGRMGAQTIFVAEMVTPGNNADLPTSLDQLLAPLGDRADVLGFRQVSGNARDAFGNDYPLLLYGAATYAAIAPLLHGDSDVAAHLITDALPPGLPVPVTVEEASYQALTIAPPEWLQRLPLGRGVLLLPEEAVGERLRFGYQELTLIVGHSDSSGGIRPLAAALRTLLRLDERQYAQVHSPEALLDELDALRDSQRRWQTGAGAAGGCIVALVFGSIAILEYRQNRFIIALLRSFGVPSTLLLGRYLIEAAMLMTLAVLASRAGAIAAHPFVFGQLGFERGLLDRTLLDPYAWPSIAPAIRWLFAGALLSVLPVLGVLRHPVGKVLQ